MILRVEPQTTNLENLADRVNEIIDFVNSEKRNETRLRDILAGQALIGILSNDYNNGIDCANYVEKVEHAYKYADQMLEERLK